MSYKSIKEETRIEYIIEKSKFIATACPCTTETETQEFISRITKEFWDANHNCTAYALGEKQELQRSSDNGEPSGTAGKPILEVLKKTGITNTAIVVTRYFGGIKLGAGGLIRAYSHSAAEVLTAAPKLLYTERQLIHTEIDYSLFNQVEYYLINENIHYEKYFEAKVTLVLYLEPTDLKEVQQNILNITNGKASWEEKESKLVALPC